MPELSPAYDDAPAARDRHHRRLTLVESQPASAPVIRPPAGPKFPAGPQFPVRPKFPAAAESGERQGSVGAERVVGAEPVIGTWPSQFAQVLAETLAGARSAEQLAPWTTQQARRRISQLGPLLACGPQPRVRRIILTSPVSGVLEMTAIVAVGSEVPAVAARLERPAARLERPAARLEGPAARLERPAAPASLRAARLRATARWVCTAVEVA